MSARSVITLPGRSVGNELRMRKNGLTSKSLVLRGIKILFPFLLFEDVQTE